MVFLATARNGGLHFGSNLAVARLKEWLRSNEGKQLRIEPVIPVRTRSQHNYYWVYLGVISQETGHTPEELHQWAKTKFLPHRFATVMGEKVELEPTTKTLSKLEFGEYLERICAETGVPLPDPQAAGYLPH